MEIQTIKSEEWRSHTNHKYWFFLKEYRILFSSLSIWQHNTKSSSYPTINFYQHSFIFFSWLSKNLPHISSKCFNFIRYCFSFSIPYQFAAVSLFTSISGSLGKEMVMITIMLNNMTIAFSFIRILILEVRSCGVDPSILRAWWDASESWVIVCFNKRYMMVFL